LDIGQADIHETLSLEFCSKLKRVLLLPVLKDLLFKGYELGIKVKFVPITIDDYESWVKHNLNNDIINILGDVDC
jgi:phosphoserine phosphatase